MAHLLKAAAVLVVFLRSPSRPHRLVHPRPRHPCVPFSPPPTLPTLLLLVVAFSFAAAASAAAAVAVSAPPAAAASAAAASFAGACVNGEGVVFFLVLVSWGKLRAPPGWEGEWRDPYPVSMRVLALAKWVLLLVFQVQTRLFAHIFSLFMLLDRDSVYVVTSCQWGLVYGEGYLSRGILSTLRAAVTRSVCFGRKRQFSQKAPVVDGSRVVPRLRDRLRVHPSGARATKHAAFSLGGWVTCTHISKQTAPDATVKRLP